MEGSSSADGEYRVHQKSCPEPQTEFIVLLPSERKETSDVLGPLNAVQSISTQESQDSGEVALSVCHKTPDATQGSLLDFGFWASRFKAWMWKKVMSWFEYLCSSDPMEEQFGNCSGEDKDSAGQDEKENTSQDEEDHTGQDEEAHTGQEEEDNTGQDDENSSDDDGSVYMVTERGREYFRLYSEIAADPRNVLHGEDLNSYVTGLLDARSGNLSAQLGMTLEDIACLPIKTYEVASSPSPDQSCLICLEHYASGDALRTLPCFHEFHQMCVDKWLLVKRVCPACKQAVALEEEL